MPWIEVSSEVQCFDSDFEAVVEVVAVFEFVETYSGNLDIFQNGFIVFGKMTDNGVNYLRANSNLGTYIR